MSKAFTSEETADEPIVVRARAPLPAGVPNYMTDRGLALLRSELERLERERDALTGPGAGEAAPIAAAGEAAPVSPVSESERRTRLLALAPRLAELGQRIASALVPPIPPDTPDEIRFGATVEVRDEAGLVRRYQIVGVDEANAREGRLAFVSPMARALLGRRVGERAQVPTPRGDEEFEVLAIAY